MRGEEKRGEERGKAPAISRLDAPRLNGLYSWQYACHSERTISGPLLNTSPTQPEDHRTVTTSCLLNTNPTQPEDHRPDPVELELGRVVKVWLNQPSVVVGYTALVERGVWRVGLGSVG